MLFPDLLLLLNGACYQIRCLPQPASWATVRLVCVIIFPFYRGMSHFGVVLVPVEAAYTLTGLWYRFGWALAKGILDRVGVPENMGPGQVVLASYAPSVGGLLVLTGVCV